MASTKIRGITIELGADATGVGKALKQVNSDLKATSSELRDVNKQLKFDPKNTELLKQKQVLLKNAVSETADKLKTLKQAEKDLKAQMEKGGTEEQRKQLRALQREISDVTTTQKKYKSELKDSHKFMTALKDSAKATGKALGTAAKEIAKGAAVITGATMVAAGTAVVSLTKQAVESYAEAEQLIGGVQKLFGDASSEVTANAREAFKTAGMSANEYMETVTSFSASLITSLGGDTEKAASYADQAIRDMSDNANTFGTDMESVQKAYEGFAKGNYTMLDNLKLGFGGSKEGMQSLIDKANELRVAQGKMGDLSIESYADIVDAIHEVQVSMNIAGTTEREAAATIEGSINMVKSAWENLVGGLADPDADLGSLIGNMVESAKAVLKNLKPVILQALKGIATAIKEIAPVIIAELPALVQEVLPSILESLTSIASSMADVLPELISALCGVLIENIPMIVQTGMFLFTSLIGALPEIVSGIASQLPDLILGIVSALTDPNNLSAIIMAGVDLFCALISNMPKIIASIIASVPLIIQNLVKAIGDAFPKMREAGLNLIKGLGQGIKDAKDWLVSKIKELCSDALSFIKKFFGIASPAKTTTWMGKMLVEGLAKGVTDNSKIAMNAIKGTVAGMNGAMSALSLGQNSLSVLGNSTGTTNNNSVTMNVYGSNNQNVNDLANVVMERVQLAINRKGALYA